MEKSYLDKMRSKETLCMSYMQKADDMFAMNDYSHSREECVYLQKAAELRYEMAQISSGEERRYQQRKLQELNQRIRSIVRIIDPELWEKMQNRPEGKKEKPAAEADKTENMPGDAEKPDVTEEEAARWFRKQPAQSFDDVAGMEDIKELLKGSLKRMDRSGIARRLKQPQQKSFLFLGLSGCGKTYVAEAFIHELMDAGYKYIFLQASDILSRYVGEAEKIVDRVFETARKNAPCVVFIDELDGVCKNRSMANLPQHAATLTTAFLTAHNQIADSDSQVIFIGATNYPDQLDTAMHNRVQLVKVSLPSKEARAKVFEKEFSDIVVREDDLTGEWMAEQTEGYDYRDICKRLVPAIKEAISDDLMTIYKDDDKAVQALDDGRYKLGRNIFEKAMKQCIPSPKDETAIDDWIRHFHMEQAVMG